MKNISDKIVEKIKTHILYSIFLENRGVYFLLLLSGLCSSIISHLAFLFVAQQPYSG
jgi:hypothetical protein